jgi:hypothetical protein
MKKFCLFVLIIICKPALAGPFNLYHLAKNYTSINSNVILEFFESNLEDINKQDENGDTPLHVHIRYLLENMYECIDLNLLCFLAKNGDLLLNNKKFEFPIWMVLDKFYNLEEYRSHYNYDEKSIRIKIFAILNCLLTDNWHMNFQGFSFFKKMGIKYFHDLGFYNIVLFLLDKIAYNILSRDIPLHQGLKKIFHYNKNTKSDFLRCLYRYSCIIYDFYND